MVHAEIAVAAPFVSHNGLVARAAERLVLVARGVDAKSLIVPEAGHLAVRAEYESNLRGYRDGGAGRGARLAAVRRRGLRPGRRGEPARSAEPAVTCRRHPASRRTEVPPLTHETDGYQACITKGCSGVNPEDNAH